MTKTRKPKKSTTFEGLPLVDAAEDVSIVINKKDISESKKKDPGSCAAALAGRRELHTDVRVYLSRMYVLDKKNKQWIRFVTPNSAQREIVSFDRGANFESGEYTFKAPSKTEKLGNWHPKSNGSKKIKSNKPRHATANIRISARDKIR